MGVDANAGNVTLLQQKTGGVSADTREVQPLSVLVHKGDGIMPALLPAGVEQHQSASFNTTMTVLPGQHIRLINHIVIVMANFIPHVDYDGGSHQGLWIILIDTDSVGMETVGRVHMGGAMLSDMKASQVIAIRFKVRHGRELHRRIPRPQGNIGSDNMAEIDHLAKFDMLHYPGRDSVETPTIIAPTQAPHSSTSNTADFDR